MKSRPRGHIGIVIVASCVVVALLGALGLAIRNGNDRGDHEGRQDSFTVRKGEFEISLPVSGELAALNQIEIRNRLEREAIITEIVPEGKWVQAGDIVLRLNDEELRTKVKDGIDEVNVAEAAVIAATSEHDIAIKERESELAKADVAIRLAELALNAWKDGEDKSKRRELALAKETAQKNAERLAARFAESAALLDKKFISVDEYKQDEIEMIEAAAKLEQADLDIEVYEKYQYLHDKAEKESELEQAIAERQRTEQSLDAKVRSAQSELDSKKYQLESKRERLRLQEQQLSYCNVAAPSPGLVVYYTSLESGGRGWGDNSGPPQIGTQLYPNQTVIILPDTSKMIASVKVSEALSGMIKPGQRATVTSDAMPDRSLAGEVLSMGVLAESAWRDPNRRDYTVKVLLSEGYDLGLKPSMRCKANIYIGRVEDALHIPVQAVFRSGPLSYVYAPEKGGYAQRKVTLGRSSELFIEVLEGLTEGDTVLLREPESHEVVSRIPAPKGPRNGAQGNGQNEQARPQGGGGHRGEGGGRRGGADGEGGRRGGDETAQPEKPTETPSGEKTEPSNAGSDEAAEAPAPTAVTPAADQ